MSRIPFVVGSGMIVLALLFAQRPVGVALQHPEIADDDAGRSPQFVNGERQKFRVALFRGRHGSITFGTSQHG